jgi:hypothetical protein
MERSIEDWCIKLGLKNYEITDDGVVNVNRRVNISINYISKIPIQFGIVTSAFNCSNNNLTTLNGSPREIYGDFDCYSNELISLEGGPREVGGGYYCFDNKLISLKGSPKEVGCDFHCGDNKLQTLLGCPKEVGGYFDCYGNPVYQEYIKYDSYNHYIRTIKLKSLLK